MLSTNSTSSIQKRRQFHRRQQSLEVPILTTPLPAHARRTKPAAPGHRRGLSLDQNLSALSSPSGFRPLLPQDQDQFQGTPPVLIQIDHTNTGHQQQHFVQESQQHRPAQPGFQAQDFQSHLQQQLNGRLSPQIVAPTPTHPNQEQALQDLQQHLDWYQNRYGHSPAPAMQADSFDNLSQPMHDQMILPHSFHVTTPQQPVIIMPHTPVSHGHSRTVPNTPQQYVHTWPSPPPSNIKHSRSQSTQFDVAPMPTSFDSTHIMKTSSPYSNSQTSFNQDPFVVSVDHDYASSLYSSSMVDALSPGRQHTAGPMPTLFEEVTPPIGGNGAHIGLHSDSLLLQAAAGASDDFNSPNFVIGGGLAMSPRTAMMQSLGEDVNATLIDTGVDSNEVDHLITDQDEKTQLWYCKYQLDNGKPCNKWFKRRENARSHVQNHLGDRQFQCNDCGKTFVRQHDMKRHAAIHKDEREHICPCGSRFARHDALTRHRQRGMCEGTLPGFEKAEEDKPKRGRPKKDRPDQKSRAAKANKARQIDRDNDFEDGAFNYASSSSAISVHSLPLTPPDTSDFDADAFINMANCDNDMYHAATSSWRDTPPTSPPSPAKCISPAALTSSSKLIDRASFLDCDSPENDDIFAGSMDNMMLSVEPDAVAKQMFSEAMSPEYGSTNASSPLSGNEHDVVEGWAPWIEKEPIFGDFMNRQQDDYEPMAVALADFMRMH